MSRVALFALVLVACIGCDQAAKTVAHSALADSPAISLLGDTIRFELARNSGAFLSLGAGLPEDVRRILFQGLVPLSLAALCILAARSGASPLALGLIAGGGIGNWIDRLVHSGVVTDYVSLGAGPLRTGIFNLADVFIVLGVLLTVVGMERATAGEAEPAEAAPE